MVLSDYKFPFHAATGLIGSIFMFLAAYTMYILSVFSDDAALIALFYVIVGILGLVAIDLFDKDFRITIALYVVCLISSILWLIDNTMFAAIFFIISIILTYLEKDKSGDSLNSLLGKNSGNNVNMNQQPTQQPNMQSNDPNTHYFGNGQNMGNNQPVNNQPMGNQPMNNQPRANQQ